MRQSELSEIKFIITGGPTREWLDPVRFISNPSSGKMGIALADAAYALSPQTVFIHGPIETALIKGRKYQSIAVESTSEMHDAVISELTDRSILIMAAAPADYMPKVKSSFKIKKKEESMTVEFVKTIDILRSIADLKCTTLKGKRLFISGFAAETNDIISYGQSKLKEKKLDMICINDVSRKEIGFQSNNNQILILTKNNEQIEIPLMEKIRAAEIILSAAIERIDF